MLTIFQNVVKFSQEITLLLIYCFVLHTCNLYKRFEGDVSEEGMKNYFEYGFSINNTIYAFLAFNLIKFFTNLIISIRRFCKSRDLNKQNLELLERVEALNNNNTASATVQITFSNKKNL